MSNRSSIEWTDATWNPIVGCSIVSPGCTNCYAMKQAARIQKMNPTGGSNSNYVNHYDGTTQFVNGNVVWTGKVALASDKTLAAPMGWRQPRRVFVNSMGDLFHEDVPDAWIDRVFTEMALAQHHTFQVLTKRPERMLAYCSTIQTYGRWLMMEDIAVSLGFEPRGRHDHGFDWISNKQFLPNVWLGVSAEDQARADERIPLLLQTPASVRFVSLEPLLGPIDLTAIRGYFGASDERRIDRDTVRERTDALRGSDRREHLRQDGTWNHRAIDNPDGDPAFTCNCHSHLDWVIVGGESGPKARPMHPDWARDLRDQCAGAGVLFFFKQWGEWIADDGYPGEKHRVGKKAAGRLLDGVEHNAMPVRA